MKKSTHIATAAKSLARLYGWQTIVDILEGSSSPAQGPLGHAAGQRIIKDCKRQAQRCLKDYDKAVKAAQQARREP